MTTKKVSVEDSNRIKHPDDWVTGDEEMTGAQESRTLLRNRTETLNKAQSMLTRLRRVRERLSSEYARLRSSTQMPS